MEIHPFAEKAAAEKLLLLEVLFGIAVWNGRNGRCTPASLPEAGCVGWPEHSVIRRLGVDSPFCSTIVLCKGFWRLSGKKDPWKEWGRYP